MDEFSRELEPLLRAHTYIVVLLTFYVSYVSHLSMWKGQMGHIGHMFSGYSYYRARARKDAGLLQSISR